MLEENEERVLSLLDSETQVWGIKSSPLTFAYENFMYDVIAHTCSQKYMNEQWYNGLPPGKLAYLSVSLRGEQTHIDAMLSKYLASSVILLAVTSQSQLFFLTRPGLIRSAPDFF